MPTIHLSFSLFRNDPAIDEPVAQGVVFFNGKVVLARISDDSAITIYDNIGAMFRVNCQHGESRVVWGYTEMAHYRHLLPSLDFDPIPETAKSA
jgi:hypothetical protein